MRRWRRRAAAWAAEAEAAREAVVGYETALRLIAVEYDVSCAEVERIVTADDRLDNGNCQERADHMEETRPKRYAPALPAQEVIEASLPCDGRTLLVADWPELARILGHAYGGDGSTFALPDLRPRGGYGPQYMIVAKPVSVPGYLVGQQWWREE